MHTEHLRTPAAIALGRAGGSRPSKRRAARPPHARSRPGPGVLATRTRLSARRGGRSWGWEKLSFHALTVWGARRTGKAAGACCLLRSCQHWAPHAARRLPALHCATGLLCCSLSSPFPLASNCPMSACFHSWVSVGWCWGGLGKPEVKGLAELIILSQWPRLAWTGTGPANVMVWCGAGQKLSLVSSGAGFVQCLALVCIHRKHNSVLSSALSSLDRSCLQPRSCEHALAGGQDSDLVPSSLLACLSFASRPQLEPYIVQHCLIPAPANLKIAPKPKRWTPKLLYERRGSEGGGCACEVRWK